MSKILLPTAVSMETRYVWTWTNWWKLLGPKLTGVAAGVGVALGAVVGEAATVGVSLGATVAG
jgi:hypothetical protein